MQALQRYDDPEIGLRIVKAYPNKLRADPDVKLAALNLFASRIAWAHQLLHAVEKTKQINKEDVPVQIVRQLKLLNDPLIAETVDRLWEDAQLTDSAEKNERIRQVVKLLQAGTADFTDAGTPAGWTDGSTGS